MKPIFSRRFAIVLVLWLAFALRLLWLHDVGYVDDVEGFTVPWMRTAVHEGVNQVYAQYDIVYPPASIYLLDLIGRISSSPSSLGPITPVELLFLKVTTIAFDLLLVALLYSLGCSTRGPKTALAGASLYAFCPPVIFVTSWWGQIDGWFILPMFLAVWAVARNHPLRGWAALGIAMAFKVQTVVLLPLMALMTWREAGWKRLIVGVAVLGVVVIAIAAPVLRENPATPILRRVSETARDFPYISAQGHNLWFAATPAARGRGLDIHSDLNATGLGISYRDAGLALLAVGYSGLLAVLFARKDRRLVFLGAALAWLLFFMLPTRIHARFLLPALPFLVAAGYFQRRWWWLFGGFSFTLLVNLLERAGPLSPSAGWLQITPTMSLINAWINVGLFVLAWVWFLWSPAEDARLSDPKPSLSTREKGFLALWLVVLVSGIAAVWWRGHTIGKEITAWSSNLPDSLTSQLDAADPSRTLIVNWPRSVWSEAQILGLIPVTPPATFLPQPETLAPDAAWVQYSPWQEPGLWQLSYHGDYVTESELQTAAATAQTILAFSPQEPAVYPLMQIESGAPDEPCPVIFADSICLVNAELDASDPSWWQLDLTWHVPIPPSPDLTIFVHGLTAGGQLDTQADGLPAGGLLSFQTLSHPAQTFRETRYLPASNVSDRVQIGLYDPVSGARLPVHCAPELNCTPDALEITPLQALKQ